MNQRLIKQGWVVIVLLFLYAGASAQSDASFAVKFNPDSLFLGQPFTVQVALELPKGGSVRAINMPLETIKPLYRMNPGDDSTAVPYEIIDHGSWTAAKDNRFFPRQLSWKSKLVNGREVFQNVMKIVVWEPGVFFMPASSAEVDLSSGKYDLLSEDQVVKINIPNADQISTIDSSGIAAMKPIIRTAPESILLKALSIFLGVCLLGGLLYYFFSKRKEEEEEIPEVYYLPHEKAFMALAEIEKRADWKKGLFKKYYDELTYVIRAYLEDRYDIPALESITDEILVSLGKKDIGVEWKQDLKRLLPMTDLIKFAKATPEQESHLDWLHWAKNFVEETKQLPVIPDPEESNEE